MRTVRRGEVWLADLEPTRGGEQAGERPVLIVSANPFNLGRSRLVVAVPFTTRKRGLPIHVEVQPPDGGLRDVSFAMCEQVRSLAVDRLGPQPFGAVSASVLSSVETRLRLLLGL
ncbi:MAG TPA: type II toxin-antitoxin system PemK/MazF family toxin [Actinomycetota bacterium]|nr:type II toxin-antitoxin system PemK/MazF family toxin [Actinomycetota bacterium]